MSINLLSNYLNNFGWQFAQIFVEPRPNPERAEDAALVFSGPQFFTALIAGVVLAFAFQLLFTNLGVAVGISLLGSSSRDSEKSESLGKTIRKVGVTVGLGTVISVTLALFLACVLAVKLSLFTSSISGSIVGLVIWATFFSLMMWLSSSAVGSLLGSIANTATSGLQAIFGTATAAIGAKAASQEVVNTAEAVVATVKKELGMGIDPLTMKENVEDFLYKIKTPELNVETIAADFERLLDDKNLQEIAQSETLPNIDRNTFVQLISERSDLSKRDAKRIAAKLESVWQKTIEQRKTSNNNPLEELANYLSSATKEQLVGKDSSSKLDELTEEIRKSRQNKTINPLTQATTMSLNSLIGLVLGRTDLSDFDIDTIIDRLQSLRDDVGEQTNKLATQIGIKEPSPPSTVRRDIENYLLDAHPWQLKQKYLDSDFRNLLYDFDADPEVVAAELNQIDRSDFVELLKQKGIYTQAQIQSTANLIEAIRLEVIASAEAARERDKIISLLADVENYLVRSSKEDFSPEKIRLNFQPILEDLDATDEQLNNRLKQLDRPTFQRMLELRGDMEASEISIIASELESTRDRILENSRTNFSETQNLAERQWLKVQSYLRDTGKQELNPEEIQAELTLLLEDPQAGANALKARLARFDRDTLVRLLSQRQDLTEEQIESTIDSIERSWFKVQNAPQKLTAQAQQQYEDAKNAIADYLRSTGKAELNPEGINKDLTVLLNNPKLGTKLIRRRLAAIDRDTLVQLLSQRDDLSEAQAEQIIDRVQATLRNLVKAPRRLAMRTQTTVRDFQSAVAEYLRSTEKEELNPEGIQRDFQLLLNDPRAGAESLQERLSKFDRDTLVQLLSQREDISQEDVNRIIDEILAVRDRTLAQLQLIQDKIKSVLDRVLATIRDYLNGLERPELNYYGIKQDLQTLFDDPQAGFEALKDRFSQLDRDTLIALLSSREDISQADAEKLVAQVERSRDRMLQRAESIQNQAKMRLEQAKLQAQQQLEETRQAAATASWWLFFTALISAVASAGAGALGVID